MIKIDCIIRTKDSEMFFRYQNNRWGNDLKKRRDNR